MHPVLLARVIRGARTVLQLSRIREMREALAERESLGIGQRSSVRKRDRGIALGIVVIVRDVVNARRWALAVHVRIGCGERLHVGVLGTRRLFTNFSAR